MKIIYVLINFILIYEAAAYIYCRRYKERDKCIEPGWGITLAFIGVFLVNNFAALILTILQRYSFEGLILTLIAVGTVGGLFLFRTQSFCLPGEIIKWVLGHRYHLIPAFILAAACVLYFAFPTKYMLGGRDPGLYFLDGIHISQTGSMQYETDEYLNAHYDELKDVLYPGYPGLFTPEKLEGMEGEPGEISPQFMPMFPSALAVGYDLGGVEGLIRVNGVIGILALLLLYYFTKEYFSQKAAAMTMGIMLFEPAQLWGVRITETEILSQVLLFLSVYAIFHGWKSKENRFFLAGGILLGIGCINRIDTYIFGAGMAAGTVYCVLWKEKYGKKMLAAYAAYMVFGMLALLYGWKFSHIYIVEHWQAGVLSAIVLLNLACFAITAALYGCKLRGWIKIPNVILRIIESPRLLKGAFGILLAVFAYAYIIRPWGSDYFVKRAMIEFCWYTSVPMVLLAMYGLYRVFKDKQEESEPYFTFFFICLASIFVYIISPSVAADHIWAGRRWITANIPFVILMGAYGITMIRLKKQNVQRFIQGIAALGVGGFMLFQSRPFLFTHIMEDLDLQYEELAQKLSDEIVYFTTDQQIASYLRYAYGKQVYLMSEEKQENYTDFVKQQGSFYYIGSESALGSARYYCNYVEEPIHCTLSGMYLEKTVGRFPRALYERKLPASIYHMEYGYNPVISLGEDEIQTENGSYDKDGAIRADETRGILFYGPYLSLEAGSYEFSMDVEGQNLENAMVEISSNAGENVFASAEISQAGKVSVTFTLETAESGIETRMWVGENSGIVCRNLEIRQISSQETIRN